MNEQPGDLAVKKRKKLPEGWKWTVFIQGPGPDLTRVAPHPQVFAQVSKCHSGFPQATRYKEAPGPEISSPGWRRATVPAPQGPHWRKLKLAVEVGLLQAGALKEKWQRAHYSGGRDRALLPWELAILKPIREKMSEEVSIAAAP